MRFVGLSYQGGHCEEQEAKHVIFYHEGVFVGVRGKLCCIFYHEGVFLGVHGKI